jgi:predicted nuclease of predicted toxin-antitoxin system
MARLYADENFFYAVVQLLQGLGHDMLTAKDAGQANKRISDKEVLAFAVAENRAVLTFNYQHFKRLYRFSPNHNGIIICTEDMDYAGLANRI